MRLVPTIGPLNADASPCHAPDPRPDSRGFMRWLTCREYRADVLAGIVVVSYYAWLAFERSAPQVRELIGTLWFVPLGLVVGATQWRNARISTDGRTRLAWRLLACASWALWASGNLWALILYIEPRPVSPPWINWAGAAYYLLNIAGCLALPSSATRRKRDLRFLFDAALLATGATVLALRFGLEEWLLASRDPSQIADLISTICNWVSFTLISLAFLRASGATRGVLALTLAAIVCGLAADALFETLLRSSTYSTGDPVDGLWFGAWVLRWIAARYAWQRYRRRAGAERDPFTHEHGYFPYVIVATGFVAVLLQVLTGNTRLVGPSVISAGIMTGLLVGRQMIELRENRRLFTALQRQEARFRSLVQHSSDLVIVLDARGRVSYLSPSVSRVVGAGSEWQPGMSLADVVHPEDRDQFEKLVGGPVPGRLECRFFDGARWREVEIVSSDLRDDAAVGGIVLNCRDVSERNELERQLRHSQKIEAVGLLAGGIAHDFNNLLGVIKGHAELMRDDLTPGSQACDDAEQILRATDRAAAVTRKILAFSRKQPVQSLSVDVNQVLSDLLPMLRQLQTRANVRLECQSDLYRVRIDPGQLEQVIVNLATNARDAMPDGGELRISTSNYRMHGRPGSPLALPAGEYVAVSVADRGLGMTDEVRARIFEPFFTTKPPGKGTGLGLAMVYGIVKEAGGGILVESAPGQGTTVTTFLPRTIDQPAVASEEAGEVSTTSDPLTVLIVDDEPDMRAVMRRALSRGGVRVIEAGDGFEALRIASSDARRIDVLLTDLVMPGMHGRDLATRFHELRPEVPIVCVTGFTGDVGDSGETGSGVVAVLSKPVSGDVLLRELRAAREAARPPKAPRLIATSA